MLYGSGVFTTAAFAGGEPLLWDKHWRRLMRDAAKLGIDVSEHDEASVYRALAEAIDRSGLTSGRARVTFADGSAADLWPGGGGGKTSLSILAAEPRPVPINLTLAISPHLVNRTSPLVGIKSCNYLEPILSLDEAKDRGFDEAIRLNERGEIASACMANLFWLNGEMLFTSSLQTGCLAGTTREHILENLECEEVEAGIDALQEADEIFLTSAGLGIVPAAAFEGRPLGKRQHEILDLFPLPA